MKKLISLLLCFAVIVLIVISSQLDKNNDTDATAAKLSEQNTAEIAQESKSLINYPVHEGRKTLFDKINAESFEECFMNTTDTYGVCMMIPSFGSYVFSPGFYSSDVMMIRSMDRVRKLVEYAKKNPGECAELLKNQVNNIRESFDLHYAEYVEMLRNMSGVCTKEELPQAEKDRVRLTVAVYLLSEINAYKSLPELLNLSKSGDTRRKYAKDETYVKSSGEWPINPQFLIYSTYRLMINIPEGSLTEQAKQARTEFLKKAEQLHLPPPKTTAVATWDSPYKEDDYRFQIPKLKNEMYMRAQEKMDLTVYSPDIQLTCNDIDTLLDELEDFCIVQFP